MSNRNVHVIKEKQSSLDTALYKITSFGHHSQPRRTGETQRRDSQTRLTNETHKRDAQTRRTNEKHKQDAQTRRTNKTYKGAEQKKLTNKAQKWKRVVLDWVVVLKWRRRWVLDDEWKDWKILRWCAGELIVRNAKWWLSAEGCRC